MLVLATMNAHANYAPPEIHNFFDATIDASCAITKIAECDHADCWGEKEAFFFGIKSEGNSLAHSFKDLTAFGENFETHYKISRIGENETLKMNLFKKAWAPTFPDRPGRNIGVAKFSYLITKNIAAKKIIYAQETEFVRRKSIFGSLKKEWKQNTETKICQEN